MLPVGWGG